MTKAKYNGRRKVSTPGKTRAGRSAYVMNPEYLALIENFRLMDDTFMSKCLENAPECIELILQIILGKKDLKVLKSQTEYPIKLVNSRIQKKGGTICAKQWKESRPAARPAASARASARANARASAKL